MDNNFDAYSYTMTEFSNTFGKLEDFIKLCEEISNGKININSIFRNTKYYYTKKNRNSNCSF